MVISKSLYNKKNLKSPYKRFIYSKFTNFLINYIMKKTKKNLIKNFFK